MSTGTKRPHAQALRDAEAFRDLFTGCAERWEIAGSVRRRKPDVADVEHVVIPAVVEIEVGTGLFSERKLVSALWRRLDELVAAGRLAKHWYGNGFRWGDRYRGVDFAGFNHEIFCCTAATWGAILLIRTGPAEFSQRVVSRLKDGGMYRQIEGETIHVASGEPVEVPDERTYLKLAGMPWVEPEARQ